MAMWFVIYAQEDSSYSLVPEADVICEPSVTVGDNVQFVYGSRKKPVCGEVKAIGDDYEEMHKAMTEMNRKQPKRSDSGLSGKGDRRQRKAKVKCIETLATVSSKNTTHSAAGNKGSKLSVLSKLIDGDCKPNEASDDSSSSDSDSAPHQNSNNEDDNSLDRNDSDSTETEELSPEELAQILKVMKGKKLKDLKRLSNLSGPSKTFNVSKSQNQGFLLTKSRDNFLSESPGTSESVKQKLEGADVWTDSETEENGSKEENFEGIEGLTNKDGHGSRDFKQSAEDEQNKKKEGKEKSIDENTNKKKEEEWKSIENTNKNSEEERSIDDNTNKKNGQVKSSDNTNKTNHVDQKQTTVLKKVARPKRAKTYEKKTFEGIFYKCKAETPGCIQLSSKYNVYVLESNLKEIKLQSKTILTIARKLVSEVYTDEAIMGCTVTGRPSSARTGIPSVIRPALDPEGVKAIYEFCRERAHKKKNPQPTFPEVKRSIGEVLNETRYTAKLREEQSAGTVA